MEGVYTLQDIFAVPLRAASRSDSIEHTAYTLTGVPSSNDIHYHLDQYQDTATLEHQVNAALQSRMPPKIAKYSQQLAIDLNLIPFYGIPNAVETPYIYGFVNSLPDWLNIANKRFQTFQVWASSAVSQLKIRVGRSVQIGEGV